MEILFETKMLSGGKLIITENRLAIFNEKDKISLPINQIRAVNFLPWDADPYIVIETSSGLICRLAVKPYVKDRVRKAIFEVEKSHN